jgi:hypothetical protein
MNDKSGWYEDTKRRIDEEKRYNYLWYIYLILSLMFLFFVFPQYRDIPVIRENFSLWFLGLLILFFLLYNHVYKPLVMRKVKISSRERFCFNIYEIGLHLKSMEKPKWTNAIESNLVSLMDQMEEFEMTLESSILNYEEYRFVGKVKNIFYKINYLMKNEKEAPPEIPRLFTEFSDKFYDYFFVTGDINAVMDKIDAIDRIISEGKAVDKEIGFKFIQKIKENDLAVLFIALLLSLFTIYFLTPLVGEEKLDFSVKLIIVQSFMIVGLGILQLRKRK